MSKETKRVLLVGVLSGVTLFVLGRLPIHLPEYLAALAGPASAVVHIVVYILQVLVVTVVCQVFLEKLGVIEEPK
jgi:hypothetical protein